MTLIQDIKKRLNFIDLLAELGVETPKSTGGKIRAFCHDDHNESMAVYQDGAYCFTCCKQFDVFDLWMHFHKVDFMAALDELALRAGVTIPANKLQAMKKQRSKEVILGSVTGFYERRLWAPEGAQCLDYARSRGWSDDTIKRARLGYAANDTELARYLNSNSIDGRTVLAKGGLDFCSRRDGYVKSPAGFLVYPHTLGMRVQYLAVRSIEGKEHRNLPGQKLPYWNWEYVPDAGDLYIVEGQADAITLAEWGIPAVAACGAYIKEIVTVAGINYHIIPDRDGKTNIEEFVRETGPLVKIVNLPSHVADINDWGRQGGTREQFLRIAKRAKTYFEIKTRDASLLDDGKERDAAMKEIFELLFEIKDPFAQSRMEDKLMAAFQMGKRDFNKFKKALQQGGGKKLTEPDIRDIWIERYPNTLWGLGFWRRYQNGYWPDIADDVIEKEIMDILSEYERQGGPTCSDSKVKSVAALARRKLYTPADQWDAQDDNVLVCANGVLNLETMQIEEHCKEHYATAGLDYDYDPSADCPNFAYLLDSTCLESKEFVQEFAGYALTTRTEHEIAIWFYGQPGSGKSTIIEGVKAMLGSKSGLLSLARLESNPRFAMVNLPGKTLVFATEAPGDYIKSAEILSAIISGEEVKLERKHKDEVDFCPRAKILWAMNTLPRARAGQGIFRRIKVVQFPPFLGKPDTQLKQRIKDERAGILNWAIEGLKRLDTRGYFDIPFAVEIATNLWSTISDKPLLFIKEWCETYDVIGDPADFLAQNPTQCTLSETLYDEYKTWCAQRSYHHEGQHRVNNEWRRLGLIPYADGNNAYWLGVRVKSAHKRQEFGF